MIINSNTVPLLSGSSTDPPSSDITPQSTDSRSSLPPQMYTLLQITNKSIYKTTIYHYTVRIPSFIKQPQNTYSMKNIFQEEQFNDVCIF